MKSGLRTVVSSIILLSGILALPVLADGQLSISIFMAVTIEPIKQVEPDVPHNSCNPIYEDIAGLCQDSLTEYSVHQEGSNLEITVEPI